MVPNQWKNNHADIFLKGDLLFDTTFDPCLISWDTSFKVTNQGLEEVHWKNNKNWKISGHLLFKKVNLKDEPAAPSLNIQGEHINFMWNPARLFNFRSFLFLWNAKRSEKVACT